MIGRRSHLVCSGKGAPFPLRLQAPFMNGLVPRSAEFLRRTLGSTPVPQDGQRHYAALENASRIKGQAAAFSYRCPYAPTRSRQSSGAPATV